MLEINHLVSKYSKFIHVSIYRESNTMYFNGYVIEKNCREFKNFGSIGMWKIKKLK